MGYETSLATLHHLLIIYFVLYPDLLYFDFLKIMANNKIMVLAIYYHLKKSLLYLIGLPLSRKVYQHDQFFYLDATNVKL
jgi:hypothetical protein